MGKEDTKSDEKAAYRAKSVLKTLSELEPELLEELSIGAESELAERETIDVGSITHIHEIADDIEKASKLWGLVSGIRTGYPSLDAKIGGLKAGEVILIGGDPNNGKSALAQNIAVNASKEHGVLFITLEMQKTEAGSRMKYMNGGNIDDLNIMFQTEYEIDYRHLEKLFSNGVELGVEVVILDYLQYMGRGMTLEEVARMSKLLKKLALKYNIPLVVIVSLRKSDGGKFRRKWTEIEIEDLMGTSAIGYDADVAMIVSRRNLDNEYDSSHLYVKVVKARNMNIDYDDRFLKFGWEKTRIFEELLPPVPTPYKD